MGITGDRNERKKKRGRNGDMERELKREEEIGRDRLQWRRGDSQEGRGK